MSEENVFTAYRTGDPVVHETYGFGVVRAPGADLVEVGFPRTTGEIKVKLRPATMRPATGPERDAERARMLVASVELLDPGILRRLVFECVGAGSRPLLEDNPDYEFPSQRVIEAVEFVLEEWGFEKSSDLPDPEIFEPKSQASPSSQLPLEDQA